MRLHAMNTVLNWSTDESGMLIGARYHDGHLRGLSYIDGGSLQLLVRPLSGEDVRFTLTDLIAFGVLEFTHGAIVLDIFVWKVDSVPPLNWEAVDSPWRVLFPVFRRDEAVMEVASKYIKEYPDAFFFQVSCSYGGYIAAICRDISVYEVGGE